MINENDIEVINVDNEIEKKYFRYDDLNYAESEESKMEGRRYLRQLKTTRTLEKKANWFKRFFGLTVIYTNEEYFDYDSDPGEEIDNKPDYMKGRNRVDSIEDELFKGARVIDKFNIMKGKTRFQGAQDDIINNIRDYLKDPCDAYVVMANFKAMFIRVGTKTEKNGKFIFN